MTSDAGSCSTVESDLHLSTCFFVQPCIVTSFSVSIYVNQTLQPESGRGHLRASWKRTYWLAVVRDAIGG